jgi:CheY-like chemotaxis protein
MTGTHQPLLMIVMGADGRLNRMLKQNLLQWGYQVRLWEPGEAKAAGEPGAVLLVDLDGLEDWLEESLGAAPERAAWPQARLTVALGSHTLRRKTLEELGAALFVAKPFDISVLRGYLMTLEHVLSGTERPTRCLPGEEHKVRVLVADDDNRLTAMACGMLSTNERYAARAAHDGIEVLEECLNWNPHCLVMDMMMPRMNGYQVLRCLQASPAASRLPVVVLSALAGVEVRTEEIVQPMVAVLEKPVRSADLLAAVERALALGVN